MPRRLLPMVLAFACAPALLHADKPRKPTPPLPADQYPMHDAHANEHVTIAAEPGDTRATRPDTRLDYYGHDMLPIRVIVTNNSDRTLTLDDARIDFIAADDEKIPAATPDDLNRRLFELKQVKGRKIPLPAPLPPLTIHHKPVDTKIMADDNDFGFKTTTVQPHSTVAGYLYYDTEGLPQPALKNATLEIRKVHWKVSADGTGNEDGATLDSFEIPLHPSTDAH